MKHYLILIFSLLCCAFASAQVITTENPYTERTSSSAYNTSQAIQSVMIDRSADITCVIFEYVTSRYCSGCWISMGASTTLTDSNRSFRLPIRSWGVLDNNGDLETKNLDERYNVQADRRYLICLFFDAIPNNARIINIDENVGSTGFYWHNIHINNQPPAHSSNGNKYQPKGNNKWTQNNEDGIVTENPYVEQLFDRAHPITTVYLTDEFTAVMFHYETGYGNNSIALNSNTVLTANGINMRVVAFGEIDREDALELDKWYNLQSYQTYEFIMFFPPLPPGISVISISENLTAQQQNSGVNGFWWKNIHINNPQNRSYSPPSNDNGRTSYNETEFTPTGSGTGFALDKSGYIVTCHHVIENAQHIQIRGVNGEFSTVYAAKVVVTDKANDIAILKIQDSKFKGDLGVIPYMLNTKPCDTGDNIYVLGYPLRAVMGDEIKLTNGLISSKTGYQGDVTTYQISAAVQPGNSGGPMFDDSGNIVGIISARLGIESAAYAVKIPYLTNLLMSVDEHIALPTTSLLTGKTTSEQVKKIKSFVYIVEVQ